MRPKTERIGGRRMRQQDIGSLRKSKKAKIIGKGSFNSVRNLIITALN
jgi:hypothetical protein